MTKQRRHRKPISKAAHHRRLGEGADETHRRMDTLHATRGDVDRGHQDHQASRDSPHPTRPIGRNSAIATMPAPINPHASVTTCTVVSFKPCGISPGLQSHPTTTSPQTTSYPEHLEHGTTHRREK